MQFTFLLKVFGTNYEKEIFNSLSVFYLVPKHFQPESQLHMIRSALKLNLYSTIFFIFILCLLSILLFANDPPPPNLISTCVITYQSSSRKGKKFELEINHLMHFLLPYIFWFYTCHFLFREDLFSTMLLHIPSFITLKI